MSFMDRQHKGSILDIGGRAQIQSQEYYQQTLTLPEGGNTKTIYFDTYRFFLSYMTKTMPLNVMGRPINYLTGMTEYRRVGTIVITFSQFEPNVHIGAIVTATIMDKIILNSDIPLEGFPPIIPE